MTRLKYYLPIGLLTVALALSLAAGFGLSAIGNFSSQVVGRLFAVPYRVELRGEAAQGLVLPQVVSACVADGSVTISEAGSLAPVTVDLNHVNLTAMDPAALAANRMRSGLMTLLLFALALLCSAALAGTAIAMIGKNRRAAALRRAARLARRAGEPQRPLPPTGPRRLPHAA